MTSTTKNLTVDIDDHDNSMTGIPPLYHKALCSAVFLSFFMSCITYVILPLPSEGTNSREKVLLVEQGMKDIMDILSAPPSVRIMTNFSWPNGMPIVDAWTSLSWFRQLHTHHIVTTTWLIVAPLQLASLGGIRWYNRTWHRRIGTLFACCSTCIALGLIEIIGKQRVYGQPHWLAMLINISKLLYFVASLMLALGWYYKTPLQVGREIHQQHHKAWILRHVTMGYAVAFQRFLMFVVGPLVHATLRMMQIPGMNLNRMLTSIEIQQWYNVTSILAMVIPMLLVEKCVIQRTFFIKLGTAKSSYSRKQL
jgi:hypothetical protein